jgi:hypothetical protein
MLQHWLPMASLAVFWWILLFIFIGMIAITPQLSSPGPIMFEMNIYGQIVQYAIVISSTLFAIYLLKLWIGDAAYDLKAALFFAVYLIFFGVLLDAVITVPFFINGEYAHFFTLKEQFIDYGLVIILCVLCTL